MDGKPILSCSTLAVRAEGHEIDTLEGLQEEASAFVGFIADQGADQCGFCNPGFVMNTIALLRENPDPTEMINRLDYLKDIRGIGVFTARPGMGKSYALRCFASSLNPNLYFFHALCMICNKIGRAHV